MIAFDAYPSEGPLETSDGPIQPDGNDVGFATLDVETGLFENVTLENAPNEQSISGPVLARDGAIVARLVSTWHEPDGSRNGEHRIVRRRLGR